MLRLTELKLPLDHQRRPLVDPQADQVRPIGEDAQQAVDPAPPEEVLVDHRRPDEPEPVPAATPPTFSFLSRCP